MEKNKIPSADEFFDVILLKHGASFSTIESDKLYDDIINRAVEFAKLHVKQALESAAENAVLGKVGAFGTYWDRGDLVLDKQSILNAYLEDNII